MPNPNRGPFATEGDFQGKPSLTLTWRADSQYPFSFGVTKARLIVACFEEIKAFADRHPEEGRGNMGQGRPATPRQQAAPPAPPAAASPAEASNGEPCRCGFCPACLESAGKTDDPLYKLGAPAPRATLAPPPF